MEFTNAITIEQIRAAKPEMVYYGANTCWWTHDPKHLGTTGAGLPCDPRGGVLFQTDDVEGFLKAAEMNASHYGRHGLRAFMAAHHLNCILSFAGCAPWCSPNWEDYNAAIDLFDYRNASGDPKNHIFQFDIERMRNELGKFAKRQNEEDKEK